jgi:hypothetical protein
MINQESTGSQPFMIKEENVISLIRLEWAHNFMGLNFFVSNFFGNKHE